MSGYFYQKLCLGTVQMGQKYGIANALGRQPLQQESFSVLQAAIDKGIFYFDTAGIYGTSEKVLGNFHLAGRGDVHIISKLPPEVEDKENVVLEELKKTLDRLQTDFIDGYLLHDARDMERSRIIHGLCKAKEMGLVGSVGVSVYEPVEAYEALHASWVDYVQIPYNVFDQRLDESDFFYLAKKYDVKIFARSLFLQGLLTMELDNLPNYLQVASPLIRKFQHISNQYGFSRKEAAFLYGLWHPGIDYVVFGVDTLSQLEENLGIAQRVGEFQACYNALYGAFRGVDRKIINPSLWR